MGEGTGLIGGGGGGLSATPEGAAIVVGTPSRWYSPDSGRVTFMYIGSSSVSSGKSCFGGGFNISSMVLTRSMKVGRRLGFSTQHASMIL